MACSLEDFETELSDAATFVTKFIYLKKIYNKYDF